MPKDIIDFADFQKIDIRIGTILEATLNVKARIPAYILRIDFGDVIGIKTSSAQLTENYQPEDLIGQQISAVINFSPLRVAGVKSEVLVLAGVCERNKTVLLHPSKEVENGVKLI